MLRGMAEFCNEHLFPEFFSYVFLAMGDFSHLFRNYGKEEKSFQVDKREKHAYLVEVETCK